MNDDKPRLHNPEPASKPDALADVLAQADRTMDLTDEYDKAAKRVRDADAALHDTVKKYVRDGVLKINTAYTIGGKTIWIQPVGGNLVQYNCIVLENDK